MRHRFDHHSRGWDHDGDGRRSRRRVIDGDELQLLLLHLIAAQPSHGYELIRAVETLTRGAYAPSPGIAYPALALLKDLELVSEALVDERRTYSITARGRKQLAREAAALNGVLRRFGELASLRDRTEAAPIRRAMQNLKSALHDKLSSNTARETILDVAALIDEATQKIERLE